jgi:hypothetical protein
MKTKSIFTAIAALTLVGCAHGNMRGTVAMKTSDNEAHVCLGDNEVRVGDKLSLFNSVCKKSVQRQHGESWCTKKYVGDAEIVQLLNQHYSVAKVAPGVLFQEGTIVEKK